MLLTNKKMLLFITLWTVSLPLGWAEGIDNGISTALYRPSFDLIGQYLFSHELKNIRGNKIDDFKDNIDYGAKLHAQNIRFWAAFKSLSLFPLPNAIGVRVGIQNIHLQVAKARIYKNGWVDVSTTCRNIDIYIAENKPLYLQAKLAVEAKRGQIQVATPKIEFQIPTAEYRVKGPRSCSGALGVGKLIASMVNSFLNKSKGRIETAIAEKVRATRPTIESMINQTFAQPIDIHLGAMYSREPLSFSLKNTPSKLSLSPQALEILFNVDMDPLAIRHNNLAASSASFLPAKLGKIGLHQQLIAYILNMALSQRDPYELTARDIPKIRLIFSTQKAAGIWPDLNILQSDQSYLRLFITAKQPLQIEADDAKSALNVRFPQLEMQLWASINQKWQPYFIVDLDVVMGLLAELNRQQLVVRLSDDITVDIEGRWAPNYRPSIDLFEADVAEMIFSSLLSYLYASEETFLATLPIFEIGKTSVAVDHLQVESPYIWMSLLQN